LPDRQFSEVKVVWGLAMVRRRVVVEAIPERVPEARFVSGELFKCGRM
jgi:hypothetical protein